MNFNILILTLFFKLINFILNSNVIFFYWMKQLNLSNDLDKEIFSLNDKDSQMKIISDL